MILIISLTLWTTPAAGFPSVSMLDLAPGSPVFHLHVFTHSWEPQSLGQLFTNREGTEFPKGLLLGCAGPLPEGPWESNCLFSLFTAQVHNLTCVPHLFILKEFPLQALSGLQNDAPSFCQGDTDLLSHHFCKQCTYIFYFRVYFLLFSFFFSFFFFATLITENKRKLFTRHGHLAWVLFSSFTLWIQLCF